MKEGFLAASTIEGHITIFDFETGQQVVSLQHPKKHTISGIAWNPAKSQELAYVDKFGQLGTVEDIQATEVT